MPGILVVDDSQFIVARIKAELRKAGLDVTATAFDGDAGLAAWREHRPDVTVLDINMPGKDGTEVLKIIKQEDPAARVVMCSANAAELYAGNCEQRGAVAYVEKTNVADLIDAVTNALAIVE